MENSDDDTIIIAASALIMCGGLLLLSKRKKTVARKKRRWWMVSTHRSRNRYSGSELLADLRKEPSGKFENFCRMSSTDFENLLNKVEPQIAKKDTFWRKAVPAQERLAVTLRLLASGDSYESLACLFKFSPQLISQIVPEVCSALISVLKDQIKLPKNPDEWLKIANGFEELWNFPNCLGAIDGKHVVIQSPFCSGSEFYNYKNTFSVVLMAAVDSNYCFTYAEVGCQGRISDGGVFRNTVLCKKLEQEQLAIPLDKPLPGHQQQTPLPFVFVTDDAFPLGKNMMKPYPGIQIRGSVERIFNYRLSRARRTVENAFGILASVFRVFRKPMLLQPEKVSIITMTCVPLHNCLRQSKTSSNRYCPPGTMDSEVEDQVTPGSWRKEQNDMTSFLPLTRIPRKLTKEAKKNRDTFAEYFTTADGRVEWQDKYC